MKLELGSTDKLASDLKKKINEIKRTLKSKSDLRKHKNLRLNF